MSLEPDDSCYNQYPDEAVMLDLRSDTVTLPSAAMRAAIAEANVGDDVYPTDDRILWCYEGSRCPFRGEA